MKYFKKIVGDKIYLSPINVDDCEQYTAWLNDIEVVRGIRLYTNMICLEKEKEILAKMCCEVGNFAIVEQITDKLIGNCSLMDIDNASKTAELGIFIGDAENRGKGYGTEAVKLLLDYGFNYLNLQNIMLKVLAFNECAIKAYEKAGFKEFGRRTKAYYFNNEYHDQIFMEILKEDFNQK
jgi:RimJ/RimL family protein N-acetyltransferase